MIAMGREDIFYELNEKALKLEKEGKNIIRLNIGEPDYRVDKSIIKAAIKRLNEGNVKYGSAAGEYYLREKIACMLNTDTQDIVITPGSKFAIYSIMKNLLNKGDRIMVFAPCWPTYKLIAGDLGIKVCKLEMNEKWDIDTAILNEHMNNIKMIVVINPNNPTSSVLSNKRVREIVEIATDYNAWVLYDVAYADLAFQPVKKIVEDNVLLVDSFSKSFSLSGWRVGYVACNRDICKRLIKFNQITISCVPEFIQRAVFTGLEHKDKIVKKARKVYKERAVFAYRYLKRHVKVCMPCSGFYIFPHIGMDSVKLAFNLLEKGIAIAPGIVFGEKYNEYVRISLVRDLEVLKDSMSVMIDTINKTKSETI